MDANRKTAKYLRANKTKMVKLLRSLGYHPTVKSARYEKLFRRRSYWLTWMEPSGAHRALLTTAAGRPFISVTHWDSEKIINLTLETLEKYDLVEVKEIA